MARLVPDGPAFAASPDGKWLALVRDGRLSLIEAASVEEKAHVQLPSRGFADVGFLVTSGLRVLALGRNEDTSSALAFTVPELEPVAQRDLPGHHRALAFCGERALLLEENGEGLDLLRLTTRQLISERVPLRGRPGFAAAAPEDRLLVDGRDHLELWDLRTRGPMFRLNLKLSGPPRDAGFVARGRLLWVSTGVGDGRLEVFRFSDGRQQLGLGLGAPLVAISGQWSSPRVVVALRREGGALELRELDLVSRRNHVIVDGGAEAGEATALAVVEGEAAGVMLVGADGRARRALLTPLEIPVIADESARVASAPPPTVPPVRPPSSQAWQRPASAAPSIANPMAAAVAVARRGMRPPSTTAPSPVAAEEPPLLPDAGAPEEESFEDGDAPDAATDAATSAETSPHSPGAAAAATESAVTRVASSTATPVAAGAAMQAAARMSNAMTGRLASARTRWRESSAPAAPTSPAAATPSAAHTPPPGQRPPAAQTPQATHIAPQPIASSEAPGATAGTTASTKMTTASTKMTSASTKMTSASTKMTTTWRDELLGWAEPLLRDPLSLREPDAEAATSSLAVPAGALAGPELRRAAERFGLGAPSLRTLALLYAARLLGARDGVAPATLARAIGGASGWTEALGGGALAEARLVRSRGARVHLHAALGRLLDGHAPRSTIYSGAGYGAPADLGVPDGAPCRWVLAPGVYARDVMAATARALATDLALVELDDAAGGDLLGRVEWGIIEARYLDATAVLVGGRWSPAVAARLARGVTDARVIVAADEQLAPWPEPLPLLRT